MSQNNLLSRCKHHVLSALLLTTGLIFISQQKIVSATSISQILEDQELATATIPLQKLPNKILPQATLTQLPNPIPPREIEPLDIPKQDPQPVPEIQIELNPPETPSSPETPEIPQTITVKKFEFTGNTAFDDKELAATVAEFINQPISFAELLQIEEIIKNKYTAGCQGDTDEPCYINSGAFIPANQTFAKEDAIVKVQIVEGSIEQINITGLKRLNQSYVQSRVQRGISQPLEREELLDQLQILQLDPLIQNFSANLTAGSRPEKSILEINIIEADSFAVDLFTNNGRAPSVGTWRRGFRINEGNLFGIGDRIFGEYTNTDGSNRLDVGYTVPLNASNTTINIIGQINETEVTEKPFDRLDIEGNSWKIEFGLRQPILRTPEQELAVGLSGTRQESITKLLGRNFAIASGADDNGSTRISALRLYQEYTKRTLKDVFAVRSQFSAGLDVFDATVNRDPLPDSLFFAWRGQGQYVRRLAPDTLIVLRSDLQLAATNLVPLEQISIGGPENVRGYRQDAILTDNGFFASAEVRLPILRAEQVDGLLQIAPFFDFGVGWNSGNILDPEEQTFIGLGLGLRWAMGDNFFARLEYGIPLIDVEDSDKTLQENGVYFSISYTPF